ncbi:MAG: undecaprenyl-diphosphate phosphatase [Nanoarchaeota archaeon]
MQEWLSLLILAVVQGVTEWLPISSSGHLVLVEWLINYDASLELEVALHLGTLMAMFVYFGKDIMDILEDFLKGNWKSDSGRMGWLIIVATLPAVFAGYFFYDFFEQTFSDKGSLVLGFAITAVFLVIASLDFKHHRTSIRFSDALILGGVQAISILPSISRSGATIAAALLLGLPEKTAVRFSFLMAIPALLGAGMLALNRATLPASFIVPTLISFATALLVVHVLYTSLLRDKKNLRWFALYSFILAVAILMWLLFF